MIVRTEDLIGAREVLELCGWRTRKSISDHRRHGFPEPVAVVSGFRVWQRQDVTAWHQDRHERP